MNPPGHAKKLALSAGLIVGLPLLAVLCAYQLIQTRPVPERSGLGTLPPLVEVQSLAPRDIQEIFTGYGSVRADREVELSAEVSGRIVEIAQGVKDGSLVRQDQPLIRIDDRQYVHRLARAHGELADVEAQLAKLDVEEQNALKLAAISEQEAQVTQDEYKRMTDLFEKKMASQKEWDFARLAHQQARRQLQRLQNDVNLIEPRRAMLAAARGVRQADIELAQLDVERCRVRAPFSGQVQEIVVDSGDRVQIGSPILRMLDPRYVEVPIELPLSVRPHVAVGSACTLTMDSAPNRSWQATLSRLSPGADTRSRTFTAYLEVDNATGPTPLVPGYFLTARVSGPLLAGVLAVPREAVLGDHVFIINGDQAHGRTVRIDALVGDKAVISGDLAPGDRVILTNLDVLYEGAGVRWQERGPALATKTPAGRPEGDG